MKPSEILHKKILIAPLNWGLGHASRCIPLIDQLLAQNNSVTIAGSGLSLKLLQKEYPQLSYKELNDYGIKYHAVFPLWLSMILQIPKIIFAIQKERNLLNKILEKEHYDLVISDNRYGLHHKNTVCILITHQLNIIAGIFEGLVNSINHILIKKFNFCWIPDNENEFKRLAGRLSQKPDKLNNIYYIGPLSRFKKEENNQIKYDVCFMLSGPEPQRSEFEKLIVKWCKKQEKKICIIRGTDIPMKTTLKNNVTAFHLAEPKLVNQLFNSSNIIVCRSGYSTIMDLHQLYKKAVFIPTPGQTEQEYLACLMEKLGKGKYLLQKDIAGKLSKMLDEV